MKTLLLLLTLLNHNEDLIKQGDTTVKLNDLDSYVYLLAPEKRAAFVTDKMQIEKNLITMLNMNIVYDYVLDNNLDDEPIFKNVANLVNEKELDLDSGFYTKLGIDQDTVNSNVRQFIIKQEYFARLFEYLKLELLKGSVDSIAREKFLLNTSKWTIPEQRNISMIKIEKGSDKFVDIEQIYKAVVQDTGLENFEKMALQYSDDPSVKLNKGNLSFYKERNFNWPFVKEVFNASVGVIPSLFKYNNAYYIVRVNEIKPLKKPIYSDYEAQIKEQLVGELVDDQFQSIINTQATSSIEVNPEVMAHVFERYKVLNEE